MPNFQGLSSWSVQKVSNTGWSLPYPWLSMNSWTQYPSATAIKWWWWQFLHRSDISGGIPFVAVPAGIISESHSCCETFSHWMDTVSTFVLWGPFKSQFIHCTDWVMLLQLPHIFGTCLDRCSDFSSILRVKSHFISTHFYVCSFYIPYAKAVWSDCQHTSQIRVTGCFPLVHCLCWRASREELFGCLSPAASCCACERCVCAGPLVLHEWRRRWALKCVSCCLWMQVWFQGQELLMLHQSDSQRCPGSQEDVQYLVRGTILNSDLFNLEMLCQLRHRLRKLCLLFLKQKRFPVTDIETGNHLKFDKSQLILAGIMTGLWQRNIQQTWVSILINWSISYFLSINCTIISYVL